MQDTNRETVEKIEIGSGVGVGDGVDSCSKNPIDRCSVDVMQDANPETAKTVEIGSGVDSCSGNQIGHCPVDVMQDANRETAKNVEIGSGVDSCPENLIGHCSVDVMQDTNLETIKKVEIGSGVDSCLEGPIDHCSVSIMQDMSDLEKNSNMKVESGGIDEGVVNNGDGKVRDDNKVESCGMEEDCGTDNFVKVVLVNSQPGIINHNYEQKDSPRDESCVRVLDHGSCGKLDELGCSIEEGLGKVSLVGNEGDLAVCVDGVKETQSAPVGVGNETDSDSESETATSSSSSSTSSSSSESDDDDDESAKSEEEEGEKSCMITHENTEQKVDIEEGEIMGYDLEKMVSGSDDDDIDDDEDLKIGEAYDEFIDEDIKLPKGPIKSKNELRVLPSVPPVNVTLQPCHQILPVGAVLSILGAQVIVEGSEKHNPLSEGSILWISETRLPLGLVDEIFGPVKTPFYIVRYNSESEVPSGIQNGSLIGFVNEFVDHVLNDKNIYQKGYDASGENDELNDEIEFSDDEKESEYKLVPNISKRGNTDQETVNKKNKQNFKNKKKAWTRDQPSASQAPIVAASQPNQMHHHVRAPVPSSRPNFPAGPTPFAQQAPQPGFMLNGLATNMLPFQQQQLLCQALPGSFQMNGMPPWFQQNPQAQQIPFLNPMLQQQFFPQIPQPNPGPFPQQFDLSQLVSGSGVPSLGPVNYAGGPPMATNLPWSGMLGPNHSNQAPYCLPNANSQFPMFPGTMSNEPRGGQSGTSQPTASFPMNADARPQFNQGFASGTGRGGRPFHTRGRGGRFGGRRGRHQSN